MLTLYSMVNETGNRNRILEVCKFRLSLVHWIDPRSIEHNFASCSFTDPFVSIITVNVVIHLCSYQQTRIITSNRLPSEEQWQSVGNHCFLLVINKQLINFPQSNK